jgi:hypothetical protein
MKRLACIFGRHDWTTHVERGEEYKVCSACGKTPKGRRSGPKGSGVIDGVKGEGGGFGGV